MFYSARRAQEAADAELSASRSGIDETEEGAAAKLAAIRDGLARGLSPQQIAATTPGLSASTVYRWVDAGYDGMTNMELRRKVGYRPRSRRAPRRATSHSSRRSHARSWRPASSTSRPAASTGPGPRGARGRWRDRRRAGTWAGGPVALSPERLRGGLAEHAATAWGTGLHSLSTCGNEVTARCRELFPRCASCGNAGPVQAVALRLKINRRKLLVGQIRQIGA